MKIKLGPAGIPSNANGMLDGIQAVHALGLEAMEVEFVRGVHMGSELALKAGELAKKLSVHLSVHAPYYINLCNPEKKDDSQKRIMLSCERARELGATIVVFHAGFYGKLAKEEALERVIKSCEEMVQQIKNSKSSVLLGLETTGKKSQFGTLEEIISLCKAVNGCVPVIDFSHIYARNNGKLNMENILTSIKPLHLNDIHCHFSGIEFSDSGERRHLPISSGKPDFRSIAKSLLNEKINATIICESPLLEKDALKMKKILSEIKALKWGFGLFL
jgi:deoxyribonuclease-4